MSEAILRTKLTGDTAELQRSLREGIDAAKEFGDKFKDAMRETLVEVTGVVLGVESIHEALSKLYEGVKGVFDLSRDLRNLSNQTGASVRDLVQLRAEFDLSGIAADHVGGILNRMQRSIEQASDKGGNAAEMFYRLGININELQQMNPAAQFDLLRQRLTAIEDPARRAQEAMKIFGNFGGGGSVLAIFGNSKIASEAANVISEQADILARNADTFQEVSIGLEIAGKNIQGFFVGIAEPIGNVILPVLQELNSIDLTKWGEKIGDGMRDAVRILYNAFEDEALGVVLRDMLSSVFTDVFQQGLDDILIGVADSFIGEMMKLLQPFSDGMVALMNVAIEDFGLGLGAILKAAGLGTLGDKAIDGAIRYGATNATTAEQVKNNRIDARQEVEMDQLRALGLDPASKEYADKATAIQANRKDLGSGIGGAGADMFQQAGAHFLAQGFSEIGKPIQSAVEDLRARYGKPIPGEGIPNDPNQPPVPKPDVGWGSNGKNITGIHMGAGGWQGVNDWTSGPVNIEGGSAGRAGRIVNGAQTVEQNTAQTNQILGRIQTTLAGVTSPT